MRACSCVGAIVVAALRRIYHSLSDLCLKRFVTSSTPVSDESIPLLNVPSTFVFDFCNVTTMRFASRTPQASQTSAPAAA